MKKKGIIFAIVIVFVLSIMKIDIHAYTSTYYKNQVIKVGLVDMKSSSVVITFNGDYLFNNEIIKNGTSFSIRIDNGRILLNNIYYDVVTFNSMGKECFITIKSGSYTRNYHGDMNFKVDASLILPVNTVNIEDYTKGVIGYEMSESYPLEALKAQAVASRSYAMYHIGRHGNIYDVTDTTAFQVYKGFDKSWLKVEQAVDGTKGVFTSNNGNLIETLYSANHAGYTEDSRNVWGSALPYFISKKDDFDDYTKYENSRQYDWTKILTSQQITDRLNKTAGLEGSKFVRINLDTIKTYVSGRISNLEIVYIDVNGNEGIRTLSADSARTYFSFKSSMYTVSYDQVNNNYIFSGHGSGHGLGMSQIGAKNRAAAGQSYKDILSFYYTGTVIINGVSSIKTAALSESDIFAGDKVNLGIEAQGGSGQGYLYKYIIERDGEVVETKDYSIDATLSYNSDNVGSYTVTTFVKDSLSKDEYDDKKTVNFKATGLGDVNLDKTVDIFDLVLISKDLNKTKESVTNWNIKKDLIKDDIIDIKDIALAAQKYNVRY